MATTPTQTTPSSTEANAMVITDEIGNPTKVNEVLDPNGELWFSKRKVVQKLTKTSFKQFMDKPYTNWASVPKEVRHRWWLAFRKEYSWDPSIAKEVKDKWQSKVSRRLTDVVSKLVNDPNYRPKWCPPSLITALKEVRDTPEFRKKSQQCSENKKNSIKGLSKHSQGSVSTIELTDKMTIENGGVKPKPYEVYKRAHTRKDGSFIDDRSEAFWNTLLEKQEANKESAEPKTDEQVYYEVAGGFDEKGRVYGIGSAAEKFYKKSDTSNRGRKGPTQHVINLENRVDQLNSVNLQQRQALNDVVTQIDLLRKKVEVLTQQVTGCSPNNVGTPQPPPPPHPLHPVQQV